jgi:hypothetical protein
VCSDSGDSAGVAAAEKEDFCHEPLYPYTYLVPIVNEEE